MTERKEGRRFRGRWVVGLAVLSVLAMLGLYVWLAAVELGTEGRLPDLHVVIDQDRGDGRATTVGEVLAQIERALGEVELEVDYEALGLDESEVAERSAWGASPGASAHRVVASVRIHAAGGFWLDEMLGNTLRDVLDAGVVARIEGRSVVVTHRDAVGVDFTAWGRAAWRKTVGWLGWL